MRKPLITVTMVAVSCAVSPASPAERGLENCYVVRGTADARNRPLSIERAERRLHHTSLMR
jgi:hypothetical protein